ncbi:MAG TPA: serine hydrolase domain-containing protein [Allosphingosinicella sp.]|jgi:CubicO group peptidase (beta-lactamase class C family)
MKLLICLAASLLATSAAPAFAKPAPAAAADVRKAALDRDMPAILQKHKVPSISVAHVERGRIVFAAAYGEQSPGVPATPQTLYNVASLTKPVSAEVVLLLASEGKLSLDEPMYTAWADPDVLADPRHKLLTPRLALSHQTGFPNWRYLAADKKLAFGHAPGQGVGYSGEGYEWFARFAARKVGVPFETLAQKLVFEPAGMKDTAYTARPWFAGRLAVGTGKDGKPVPAKVPTEYVASDDIHTTAADYARFMIFAAKGKGLTRSIRQQRQTVQASTWAKTCAGEKAKTCPNELGFGLGWEVLRFGGETILFHTGADKGEFTLALFNPRTRNGTVVLTSHSNGAYAIVDVLDRIGGEPALLAYLHTQADY